LILSPTELKKVIFTKDAVTIIKNLDIKYKKAIYENEHLKQELIQVKRENAELKQENKELKKKNLMLNKQKEQFLNAVNRVKQLEEELKKWKEAALKERELRLGKTIPENLRNKTIEKIKEDYNLSL